MKDKKNLFYGWKIIFVLFLCMFLIYPPVVNSSSIFIGPVTQELNFRIDQFILNITILAISGMIMSPFMGMALAKYRAKKVMIFGVTLCAIGVIGFGISKSLLGFYFFAAIQGIGLAGCCLTSPSIIANNWFQKNNGLAVGIAMAGSGIGGMFYSFFAQYMIINFGYQKTYILTGILIFIILVPLIIKVVYYHPNEINLMPFGYENTKNQIIFGISRNNFLKSPSFYLAIASVITGGIVINGTIVNIAPYLTSIGYDKADYKTTLIISLGIGSMALGKIIVGKLFDNFGLNKSFILIGSFMLIFIICLLNAKIYFLAIIYAIFMGISTGNANVTPALLTRALSGNKEFGPKFGIMAIFISIAAAISPIYTKFFISGIDKHDLISLSNAYINLFYSYIFLSIITVILMVLAVKFKPKFES